MIDPIKPMLASPPKAERVERLAGTHWFDLKLDGLRAIAYWDGSTLKLINRSMKDITASFPDLEATFPDLPPCVLDGEIVADSGSFQDVARRGKQTKPADVARHVGSHPVSFVAFDALNIDGADLRSHPYFDRRMMLDGLATLFHSNKWTTSVVSKDPAYFEQVKALGMEGVIAKRIRAPYRSGRFSDWIKFKAVRSITCVAVGYETGEGARAHFGAMFLALISDAGVVRVGRVGTGFTMLEIEDLKHDLDAGLMPLVEIECLNVTKDGLLRFPVYKGRRHDLSVADATFDQLVDIPRC